jgi:L-arabinose isomerase
MSHMGEVNIALTGEKPVLTTRPYPFSAADEPVIASGCLKGGSAWLVNLAPGPDNTFSLITIPVEVCNTEGKEKVDSGIRGWIKSELPAPELLKQYSLHGGTHHKVLCYGDVGGILESFAQCMGWHFVRIGWLFF